MTNQTNARKDKDPWTGKEILRFPTFGRFNLHAYYSRRNFTPNMGFIAASTPKEGIEELKRGVTVPGQVQILTFPEGNLHLAIDDVPVPMHGGSFEFTKDGRMLGLQLEDNKMGLVHINTKRIIPITIKGELKSLGADERSILAISSEKDSKWLYRLDEDGRILEERLLVQVADIDEAHPIHPNLSEGLETTLGNDKLSESGKFFMMARKILDKHNRMCVKHLIQLDIESGKISYISGGDIRDYDNVEKSFHHAAWVNGKNKIIYHALLAGEKRLTFRLYDSLSGSDHKIFPVFGAKGHHSVMSNDERLIITDSLSGDLDGVVSAIDLTRGVIHPLAAWDLDENRVEGHPSLSPDGKWVMYDCNVDGGSEVRAVRLEV